MSCLVWLEVLKVCRCNKEDSMHEELILGEISSKLGRRREERLAERNSR